MKKRILKDKFDKFNSSNDKIIDQFPETKINNKNYIKNDFKQKVLLIFIFIYYSIYYYIYY